MLKIVKIKILLTGKGEARTDVITLPSNASRIVGISIVNNVKASAFPPAQPYVTPPPTLRAISQLNLEATQQQVLQAIAGIGGAPPTDWERLGRANDLDIQYNYVPFGTYPPPYDKAKIVSSIVFSSVSLGLSITETLDYQNLPTDQRIISRIRT